jgi:hypothetical protein
MAPASEKSTTPELRRYSIRIPHPIWLGLTAVALLILSMGLHIGLSIYRRESAIGEIARFGGWVGRSHVGPEWLRELTGEERIDRFAEVHEVHLTDSEFGDADVPVLLSLPTLKAVHLDGTKITDAGLSELATLSRLEELTLKHTGITDRGLGSLQRLPKLRVLDVNCTGVTNDGLAHLANMSSLRRLWLDETKVTRRAAAELNEALPNRPVQWVGLWGRNDPFGVLTATPSPESK